MVLWPFNKYYTERFLRMCRFHKLIKHRYTISLNIIWIHINLVFFFFTTFGNNHLWAKYDGLFLCSHPIWPLGDSPFVSSWLSYLICFLSSLINCNNTFLFMAPFIVPVLSTLWMLYQLRLCLAVHVENLTTVLNKLEFTCIKWQEVQGQFLST